MNHQAIRNLYPQVWVIETTDKGEVCYDKDNNIFTYDKELVKQEAQRLQEEADKNKYKLSRAQEYPSVKEFADAMFWASQGDDTKLQAYYAACQAVKDKYPKPE
jgi:CO dehydrogenase/acetyl-CoA synthase alpha subunit